MSAASRTAALRAIAPLALMGLIFFLSAQPDPGPDLGSSGRVIAHFSEYALLAALWAWALTPALERGALLAAAAVALVYALSDEYHQGFVSGRDSDPLDVVVDAAGIAFALALSSARSRRTADRVREPPA